MKAAEKRLPRSYKAKETPYYKAVRRAWKENTTLVNLIERFVELYSAGAIWSSYIPEEASKPSSKSKVKTKQNYD